MKSYDCKTCAVGARQSQTLGDFFKKLFLRGKEQTAPATVKSRRMASAPVPTPGSTWIHLVSFTLEDGKELGKVTDVLDYPGNKVYVVKGEHEYMIPAVKAFVLSTDLDANVMQVKTIKGMRTDES